MDKSIIMYLEVILRLIKGSKDKEESLEGLIMQLAMLEKIRDVLNNTISKLQIYVSNYAKNYDSE
jgi:hypothetical protein|tara:strand:+ start:4777 stop:4971 length:195 start_codon:yes stop_codon:yes gene_type:complete